jgi:hypothetical protein
MTPDTHKAIQKAMRKVEGQHMTGWILEAVHEKLERMKK